jgi:hypothetical protein
MPRSVASGSRGDALVSSATPRPNRGQPRLNGEPALDDTYPPPPPPDPSAARDTDPDRPPAGLGESIGAVRSAAERLIRAHIELLKTEISEIAGEVARLVGLLALSMGCLFVLAIFLPTGLFLFLGEWLFGSLGWGVLHGLLFFIGMATAFALAGIGISGGRIGRDFALALIIAIFFGIALVLDLTNRGWTELGARVLPTVDPVSRPLLVAVIAMAIVGGIVGFIAGWPRGGGATAAGLLGGVLIGAGIGALTAVALGPRVGAAVAVATGLLLWPIFMGLDVARQGIDLDALKARFYPEASIETGKETIAWVRERMPRGPTS